MIDSDFLHCICAGVGQDDPSDSGWYPPAKKTIKFLIKISDSKDAEFVSLYEMKERKTE